MQVFVGEPPMEISQALLLQFVELIVTVPQPEKVGVGPVKPTRPFVDTTNVPVPVPTWNNAFVRVVVPITTLEMKISGAVKVIVVFAILTIG